MAVPLHDPAQEGLPEVKVRTGTGLTVTEEVHVIEQATGKVQSSMVKVMFFVPGVLKLTLFTDAVFAVAGVPPGKDHEYTGRLPPEQLVVPAKLKLNTFPVRQPEPETLIPQVGAVEDTIVTVSDREQPMESVTVTK